MIFVSVDPFSVSDEGCALRLVRRVDGEQLVPEEVRAGLEALRDRRRPRVVIRDKLTLSPGARVIVATNQACLVDFELIKATR